MDAKTEPPRFAVEIAGKDWQQVGDFSASGPRDRHYVVRVLEEGRAALVFGDGKHGRRPPVGARGVTVSYQPGSGSVSIVLRPARARPEDDDLEPGLYGLFRGVVIDAADPAGRRRLLVQVPEALGLEPAWALACLPPGARELPAAGQMVWVQFEQGDPRYPVWTGVFD